MFSEDELHQARSVSVLKIAEDHGAKLKPAGRERVGPCQICGGVDRFAVWPAKNIWNCRGCRKGGDAIKLEMHLSGASLPEAVRTLIGQDAGTTNRRQPTPDEIKAREAERRRAEAEEQARNESSAARIIARLQPIIGTPGEAYFVDVRRIDLSHWAIRRTLESVETLGWCERTFFRQPGHELHGQWLGAIIARLTDPITGERTGGITRTYLHQGHKVGKAKSLGGVGRLGIIRLTPDDEVETGLHIIEGLESAFSMMMKGFVPMWAVGSSATMAKFPVLVGHRMPHGFPRPRYRRRRRKKGQPGGRARGLPAVDECRPRGGDVDPEEARRGRQRHHPAEARRVNENPEDFLKEEFIREKFKPARRMNEKPEDFDAEEFKSQSKDSQGRSSPIKLTWHGEDVNDPLVAWLVEDMLYQEGIALIAGQWGTYKTFVAIDLATSVMTRTSFAGRPLHRQGGVLFIAAEGQAQVQVRLKSAALGKVAQIAPDAEAVRIDPEKMPFVWAKRSPRLSDPKAIEELRAMADEAAHGMKRRFDLPLALIVIDALMPAAQFKDADKSTEARQVMDMLAAIGREFNVLVVVVDHFGKDVSTGTRNASSKEDAADSILALLGERSLEGKLSTPRMALRKVKGAEQGVEFPFEPREVVVGQTDGARPIITFVIDWLASAATPPRQPKTWPASLRIFQRALDKTLLECGKRMYPFADGPEVLAAPSEAVRAEFVRAYPAENEDLKAKAKAKAFERAIKQAINANLVCVREIEAEGLKTFCWRVK
jgi:hypothetical protein